MKASLRAGLARPGGALLAWLAVAGLARAACPAPAPTLMVERVLSAACAACWSAPPAWSPPPTALVLDWVVPASEDAALQPVALPEALSRWPEAGTGPAADRAFATAHRVWPLAARRGAPRLVVQDGPAWNGYLGLSLRITRPDGAAGTDWSAWQGHVALVESVPAGDEGSATARQLVRGVVGPLTLAPLATQRQLTYLQAMRVPDRGQAGRWTTVGWLSHRGEPRVAARAPAPDCAR
jgi:hypothetical protein